MLTFKKKSYFRKRLNKSEVTLLAFSQFHWSIYKNILVEDSSRTRGAISHAILKQTPNKPRQTVSAKNNVARAVGSVILHGTYFMAFIPTAIIY